MSERDALLKAIADNPEDTTLRGAFADWLDEHGEPKRAAAIRNGIIKRPGVDFIYQDTALTLDVSEVSEIEVENGHHSRTHEDGWTISGEVHEDYYVWVNDFEASHPEYGLVWGNFESLVFASSEEGFQHFWQHHEPKSWDYADI